MQEYSGEIGLKKKMIFINLLNFNGLKKMMAVAHSLKRILEISNTCSVTFAKQVGNWKLPLSHG